MVSPSSVSFRVSSLALEVETDRFFVPYPDYGLEQGFTGGADPANREPMWSSNYSTSAIGYTFTKQLNALRKAA